MDIDEKQKKELMLFRLVPTQTRIPTIIPYTPMDSINLLAAAVVFVVVVG